MVYIMGLSAQFGSRNSDKKKQQYSQRFWIISSLHPGYSVANCDNIYIYIYYIYILYILYIYIYMYILLRLTIIDTFSSGNIETVLV